MWHLSIPLMNSFNKTKAAIFSMRAMLSEDFSLLLRIIYLPLSGAEDAAGGCDPDGRGASTAGAAV